MQEAALILQVTDISNPHNAEQDAEVLKVLGELGVKDRPRLHVLNKIDRLSGEEIEALKGTNGHGRGKVFTSAVTGEGLEDLLASIDSAMPVDPLVRLRLRVPVADGRHLSLVQARGRILHSEVVDEHFLLEAELPESAARRLQKFTLD